MKKKLFADSFSKSLDENFPKYSKYFDFELSVFCELNTLIFEINKCQLFEFHRATITLTNHLLEKDLKLALIYNETGIGAIEIEKWNSTFEKPNKKVLHDLTDCPLFCCNLTDRVDRKLALLDKQFFEGISSGKSILYVV